MYSGKVQTFSCDLSPQKDTIVKWRYEPEGDLVKKFPVEGGPLGVDSRMLPVPIHPIASNTKIH